MKRGYRITLELLGPPLLGGVLFWLAIGVPVAIQGHFEESGKALLLSVIFAYFFAGIQSIFYTAIMEWRFARGLDPRSWRSVLLSTVLGLVSGLAIVLAFGFRSIASVEFFPWVLYSGIGLAVGFLLGLMIKILTAPKPVSKSHP